MENVIVDPVEIAGLAFYDEEVFEAEAGGGKIHFSFTGASSESGISYGKCCLIFDGVRSIQAKRWDIEFMHWLDAIDLIHLLREVSEFEVEDNIYTFRGFTRESDWIEMLIHSPSCYFKFT